MNHPLTSDERATLVKMLNEHGYKQVLLGIASHARQCEEMIRAAHGQCRTVERWEQTVFAVEQWAYDPKLTHCSVPTWDVVER